MKETFFDQPVKDNINCDRLRGTSKKIEAINLSKKQAIDADPKAM